MTTTVVQYSIVLRVCKKYLDDHPSDNTEVAILSYHQPAGWNCQQTFVVTRRWHNGKQWLAVPRYSVILVSRSDLALAELVRRHREKQGQENAQKKNPLINLDLHHPPCPTLSVISRQSGFLRLWSNGTDFTESFAAQGFTREREKTWYSPVNQASDPVSRAVNL